MLFTIPKLFWSPEFWIQQVLLYIAADKHSNKENESNCIELNRITYYEGGYNCEQLADYIY
jgi:hypothetical protein